MSGRNGILSIKCQGIVNEVKHGNHSFCGDKFCVISFSEAVITNEEECQITGKKICQCDRSKLHFGPDPKNCDTALIPCDRIGIELKRNGMYEQVITEIGYHFKIITKQTPTGKFWTMCMIKQQIASGTCTISKVVLWSFIQTCYIVFEENDRQNVDEQNVYIEVLLTDHGSHRKWKGHEFDLLK